MRTQMSEWSGSPGWWVQTVSVLFMSRAIISDPRRFLTSYSYHSMQDFEPVLFRGSWGQVMAKKRKQGWVARCQTLWKSANTSKTHNHIQSNQTSAKIHKHRTKTCKQTIRTIKNKTSTTIQQTNWPDHRFGNDIELAHTRWPAQRDKKKKRKFPLLVKCQSGYE